jgi:uncharacterized protein (TIGR02001 family)
MKKTAVLLAALVAGASVQAQESSYSITLDFPYVSEYVFRGISYADDAIQPSVEFSMGDFYAGVWTSQPITNRGGATNEFDFYAGYGIGLSDTWTLDLGATYYYYPQSGVSGDHQVEPYVGIAGDIGGGFSATLYTYYEYRGEVFTYQGSLGYTIPLTDRVSLDLSGTVGYVDPDSSTNSYRYYGLGAVFTHTLSDKASAYIGLNYTNNNVGMGVRRDHTFINTGITVGF